MFTQSVNPPLYSDYGLKKALDGAFGDKKLSEVKINLLIPSYDTFQRSPVVFQSWEQEDMGLKLADVVKASCSAPTYFPAHGLEIGKIVRPLIDGGVVANNPSMLALTNAIWIARKTNKFDKFMVVSLGTGKISQPFRFKEVSRWGLAKWATKLIDVFMDTSEVTHFEAATVLGDEYFRMQCIIDAEFAAMDNASKDNIESLIATAEAYMRDGGGRVLEAILKALKDDTSQGSKVIP